MTRNITVYSTTAGKKVTINTDAATWGELKNDPNVRDLLVDNMTGAVKETRVTLSDDGAKLPEGPCTIYLLQSKTKAGLSKEELREIIIEKIQDAVEDIADEIVEELQEEHPETLSEEEDLEADARSFIQ